MSLSAGQRLPDATMVRMGVEGPEQVQLSEVLKGRKVVVFALPGAFTGPCTTAHIPSFIRTADAFRAKGVDEIICIAVNDPFVLQAWGESTGRRRRASRSSAMPTGRSPRRWAWISPRRRSGWWGGRTAMRWWWRMG
jgi:peroxiredoxin